ncbi:bifunctional indole-3-glycerol-phosphate synthase TrpC/phosphoribosylanthranilate isomerase TrpF [Aliidiomarina quisquiliarum]|uniref:bifunctional indole-3-glycerol-phosphate synthase TrpC/phosphoribosylanthranilate isomerase TrpF n=1 Tax=Aliidiomarina quisquiliarum TaxID=2938947 RepID=UPI00208F15D3|nr:bifunctional indole-3-glycerol-phosphate synthase TrpC/phosphoribosylanthranilate isomerase TrpF [Aliidiomarina quisquiliarum]MCO4320143.1 bifunctional indole-3-glycerol-phosphate synthase TrpC/phosphoribosylanthranilate isomerase TrpF [Aliidiomarina quisquiliarum]
MSNVLTRIITQRHVNLAAMQEHYPEQQVRKRAALLSKQVTHRSLMANLRAQQPGFILECKKASPSKGVIRGNFNAVDIARIYEPYAAAISVLTEPDFFAGSFDYLQAVSEQVRIPVLCKDFIVTEYQVALARYFGADAILLMLSALNDDTYLALVNYARELNLEVLTEVSDRNEMERAVLFGAPLIGINHRNLKDLSIDLNRTAELAPLAPAGTIVIAESGIHNNTQVRALAPYVHGFLIGSSLTAADNIDQACRRLIYGENKVCGLTHPDQALTAFACGALYGGLIFAKRSPRLLEQAQAALIVNQVPQLSYVGIFSADDQHIDILTYSLRLQRELKLTAIQLHDFDPEAESTRQLLKQLRNQKPANCEVWFALSVHAPLEALPDLPVDRFVLDHSTGGTGQTFNWDFIPATERHRMMLAGGLGIDNVADALALKCRGLDFNSRLEVAPGVKNPALVRDLFHTIRATITLDVTKDHKES